jgi:hypothetical protein
MAITYAQAARILEFNFGGRTEVNISPLWIGLSKSTPTAYGGNITEPTGNYGRISVDNTPSGNKWSTASLGILSNAGELSFIESTSEWAATSTPITHIFIADTEFGVGTSVLYFEALSANRPVPSNTTVYFSIGALTVTMA